LKRFFNWYVGLAGGVGSYSFNDIKNFDDSMIITDTLCLAQVEYGIDTIWTSVINRLGTLDRNSFWR